MQNIHSSEGFHKIGDNIYSAEAFRNNNQAFIDEMTKWGSDNDAEVVFMVSGDGKCYCKHRFIEYDLDKLNALENEFDAKVRREFPNAKSTSIIAPVIIGHSLSMIA